MAEHLPGCSCCGGGEDAHGGGLGRREVLRWGVAGAGVAAVASGVPILGRGVLRTEAAGAAAPNPDWPVPPIISRAEWGADESLRIKQTAFSDTVEKIVVHHTVTPNNPADPAAVVRSVYAYHTSTGYWDIAYNWLIDHLGNIYQGRWAAKGDIVGERDGEQVIGGHTSGFNTRTIGVAFLGTHTTQLPTPAALEALRTLLAWKCARWGINPTGSSPYLKSDATTVTVPNIMGHRDAKPTTCPGDPVLDALPAIRNEVKSRVEQLATGYYIADATGSVFAFGSVPDAGDPKREGTIGDFAGIAAHPTGQGYWVAGRRGGVFQYGIAQWHGSLTGQPLTAEIVDIASTRSGDGYWMLARDGSIFTFGDAPYLGSTRETSLQAPVNRLIPHPRSAGYWVLAEDGGVFTFGNADFYGSMGDTPLNAKVIAMAATPTGRGYWLLGGDGGVFSFGDAEFHGSTGGMALNAPVVDILPARSGRGYVLVAGDGGAFTFGDVTFYGSAAGLTTSAIRIAGVI